MINYDYGRLTGEIITREDFEYEEERKAWNRAIEKYPLIIVYCKTEDDIKNVRAATHGLIIIEKSMIVFYLGGSVSIGYTVTTSSLPEGITVNNSDRTVTIKSTKTQVITCFYAFL